MESTIGTRTMSAITNLGKSSTAHAASALPRERYPAQPAPQFTFLSHDTFSIQISIEYQLPKRVAEGTSSFNVILWHSSIRRKDEIAEVALRSDYSSVNNGEF